MWAIKIFDDEPAGFSAELARFAAGRGAGLELALYGERGFEADALQEIKKRSAKELMLHLGHPRGGFLQAAGQLGKAQAHLGIPDSGGHWLRGVSGKDIWEIPSKDKELVFWEGFEREAQSAKELGAQTIVVHYTANSMAEAWKSQDPRAQARLMKDSIGRMNALGLKPFMEKTYESLEWLEAFYLEMGEMGLAKDLGFVFDMGHSRVWEKTSLWNWFDFLKRRQEAGFSLHFHLHGNPGDMDRHEPLPKAEQQGWLDNDEAWAPGGAVRFLEAIAREMDQSLLVLENQTPDAKEALLWAQLVTDTEPAKPDMSKG